MLKNYLTIALRNLRRHKGYTAINVAGLAVGMACCLLILLFVRDELSYDRYHEKADRIYRLGERFVSLQEDGREFTSAATPPPWAPVLKAEFPEIENIVRIYPGERRLIRHGDVALYEGRLAWADSTMFEVFTLPLVRGNPETALTRPYTAVLSQRAAHKYFGDEDPVGQTITVEGEGDFQVTGLIHDMPANSHLRFDVLLSMTTLPWLNEESLWISHFFYTYLVLPPGYAPAELEQKLPGFIDRYLGREGTTDTGSELHPFLQPLRAIHLHSSYFDEDIAPQRDIRYIYIFATIAALILLIACINYVNLATARSARRAREVGIRKVLGAGRAQLVRQFLAESVLLALSALILAVILVEALLPLFNAISRQALEIDYGRDAWPVFTLVLAAALVGLGAGSYPAFVLSAFRPAQVMQRGSGGGQRGRWIRQALVVFQFAISVVLIVGTTVVIRQLQYVQDKKLGFDKEHVVTIPIASDPLREQYESFRALALEQPGIVAVGASRSLPGKSIPGNLVKPEGLETRSMRMLFVDGQFPEAVGMQIVQGRSFSEDFPTDAESAFLLNETAVKALGWENPIGKDFAWVHPGVGTVKSGKVVGVVKDFNIKPLQEAVEPMVLLIWPQRLSYAYVRVAPGRTTAALDALRKTWQRVYPAYPFEYTFLDEHVTQLYQAERQLAEIFGTFALLAILIACLGLFGLAAFTAKQRTKEIGIRKALGASAAGIVALLAREFLKPVLAATILAAPVAYLAMNRWLEDFAYRIELGPGVFVLVGALALLIALLTVSYQAVRAALADPVESLRYE